MRMDYFDWQPLGILGITEEGISKLDPGIQQVMLLHINKDIRCQVLLRARKILILIRAQYL